MLLIRSLAVDMDGATPTNYFVSYEYEQIQGEIAKLNEKVDLVISILQKKPKKTTISEVNSKVDDLLEQMKKRKIEE